MSNRLTKLEIIAASKPQIITLTRMALDKGKSSESIAARLNKQFKLRLTKSTVEKYRTKRWLRERQEMATQKADYAAKAELIKEKGLDAAAQALLFEQVRELHPGHLLGILRLKVQKDRLRLARKALKQGKTLEALEGQGTLPTNTAEEKAQAYRKVANNMRRIFGLGDLGEDGLPTEESVLQVEADERRLKCNLEEVAERKRRAQAREEARRRQQAAAQDAEQTNSKAEPTGAHVEREAANRPQSA